MSAMLQSGYGGLEVYRFGKAPRPVAAAGEVVIAVRAAGVDRGTWHMMTGRPYLMRVMGFGFSAPKAPVPGLEVAGVVVEVGAGVTRFQVGDEVFGVAKGSFAQFAAALESKLAKKPAQLSFEQAAAIAASGSTAMQAVEAAKLAPGMRVLILGASGGVGSVAVQLAHALGAHVTALASQKKLAFVRSLGADEVRDYKSGDLGEGYDAILDAGGGTAISTLRRALSPTGVVVFIGNEHGGDWSAGFGRLIFAALVGAFTQQRFVMLMNKETFAPMEQLAGFAARGVLKPHVDAALPLEQLPEAMRRLIAGEVKGKLVLTVG
jgi:NADPH:quinone reductase-like Zn-dependent oxidoreductase